MLVVPVEAARMDAQVDRRGRVTAIAMLSQGRASAERRLPSREMANRPRSGRLNRADRIVETRRLRERGLTQREIAERLDVSVSTVANDLRSTSSDGAPVTARSRSTPPPRTTQRAEPPGSSKLLGPLRAIARRARRLLP
jgi:HTH domain